MPVGGARPGAGRPKGSKNKRTKALMERLDAEGADPVNVLVEFIRHKDDELRFRAAQELMRYAYPRLAASTVNLNQDHRPIELVVKGAK